MEGTILSWLIFLPLVFLPVVLALPNAKSLWIKTAALVASLLQFLISLKVLFQFNGQSSGIQFVEKSTWIQFKMSGWGTFSAEYFLGLDGINIYLVVLSTFVLLVGVISSWKIAQNVKGYFALYLLLMTAVVGCFAALDLLLFFVFFEFMLLPMYFLIGIWGGPEREYAAIKFFIYTLFGSVCILLVIIGLYNSFIDPVQTANLIGITDITNVQSLLAQGEVENEDLVHTFNMLHMTNPENIIPGSFFDKEHWQTILGFPARNVGFLLLFVGFCVKLPAVPLHTWLPSAHVQAPTPISVVLAGILLKIGGYGLIRVAYPIFPDAGMYFATFVSVVAMITIVYASYVSLAQKELKRLVAYSSVAHMGFVILGIASYTTEGVNGALYQMISHGIISPMLFLAAGVIYDRTGNLGITEYKGIVNKMPVFTAFTTVAFFASLGLPGFGGFIAELFVFLGAFGSSTTNLLVPQWVVLVSLSGLIITAAYYLWTLQRMFFGKLWVSDKTWLDKLHDLTIREYIMLVPLGILTIVLGLLPALILDKVSVTVLAFVELINK